MLTPGNLNLKGNEAKKRMAEKIIPSLGVVVMTSAKVVCIFGWAVIMECSSKLYIYSMILCNKRLNFTPPGVI